MSKQILMFAALLANCYWCSANSPDQISPFDERNFESVYESIVGSPALLKILAEKEEIIYILISQYMNKSLNHSTTRENTVMELAQSYVAHFEHTTGKMKLRLQNEGDGAVYRANNVAWNPLSVYHLMRRFLGAVKEFVRQLNPKNERDYALQRQILHIMNSIGWPSELDLKEAMAAILRIHHVYDLSTEDIASGFLNGTNTGIVMSAHDCNAIGIFAMKTKYYALAVEWLELSVKVFHHIHNFPAYEVKTCINTSLQKDLETAIEMHDQMFEVHESWDPMFFNSKVNSGEKRRVRRRTSELENFKGRRESAFNDVNYWGVCSGENYQTEEDKSKLFCWYETKAQAYWKINPLKAELLSFHPLQIVQFYDLISSEMINKIKENATPNLMKSSIDDESNREVFSDVRTSWNSWIQDTSLPKFQSIPRTVQLITGLEVGVESSEALQVASYSSGSHYVTHLDATNIEAGYPSMDFPAGDRLATFIYYLSEVGKGGGTAFPQSGIATVPKKGSAVFWYNLERSGEVNWNSWHGSCPVILGEKWIANKWVLSHDQMFTSGHKCLKDRHASFDIKVNGAAIRELVL